MNNVYCFLQITFKLKNLLVILLLFQLTPFNVTTYPFDGAHCNAYFKYLNGSFNN